MKKLFLTIVPVLFSAGSLFASLPGINGTLVVDAPVATTSPIHSTLSTATAVTISDPFAITAPTGDFTGAVDPVFASTTFNVGSGSVNIPDFLTFTVGADTFSFQALQEDSLPPFTVLGTTFLNLAYTGTITDSLGLYAPTTDALFGITLTQSGASAPSPAISFAVTSTPEPGFYGLIAGGLGGLIWFRRRKQQTK